MMANRSEDRSLGELFAELTRETRQLVRQELELATTELSARAKKAAGGAGVAAVGGALIHAGLLILLTAIVIGLTQMGIAAWLSALLVAIAVFAIGYLLVNRGIAQIRRTRMAPTHAIESLKETATWTTRQGV
jgi:hypothetical protein